jgi:hypothetical protein
MRLPKCLLPFDRFQRDPALHLGAKTPPPPRLHRCSLPRPRSYTLLRGPNFGEELTLARFRSPPALLRRHCLNDAICLRLLMTAQLFHEAFHVLYLPLKPEAVACDEVLPYRYGVPPRSSRLRSLQGTARTHWRDHVHLGTNGWFWVASEEILCPIYGSHVRRSGSAEQKNKIDRRCEPKEISSRLNRQRLIVVSNLGQRVKFFMNA